MDKCTELQKQVQDKGRRLDMSSAENMWQEMKDCFTEAAKKVCGKTRGPPKHRETGWWSLECETSSR